ncbi:MAG: efflux RND transporter periplasmic adaptor subunit, partial [bacterium]
IEKAETDVAQWQTTVEFNRKELAREEELLKQDFTSQQACDRAREQLDLSLSRLSAAQKTLELAGKGFEEEIRQISAEINRAEAAVTDAKTQLSYATIIAPIDGVIASISTQEGETVAAGLNAPTFVTIIDLERLQVDTFVDEVDIGKIQIGQKVIFTVDAFPAREFEGEVAAIYPKAVIQENVVNYDVVINITSPYDGLLRPEMTASVTISLEPRRDALSVPSQAIQRQRGKSVVFVQTPVGPEEREVKVGWRDGQWVEVVQGLREGETVLLEAPQSKNEVTK